MNYSWTQGTRLGSVTTQGSTYRYSYDENGLRYKKEKVVNDIIITNTTRYYYDGTRVVAEEKDGELTRYYYDSSGVIGMFYDGNDYYFTKNLFGDIIKVVKRDGVVVAQYSYDVWGKCTVTTNVDGMANINPFRYRGYYYDVESDLYYLQSRYYSPEFRRFISLDSYGLLPDLAQAGDLNLYAYCSNNPVMYTDPDGRSPILQFILSLLCYAGIFVATLFDEEIRADMNAIGWNPFNTDESATLNSSKVSFYKGVPVFRTSAGGRSGSFGAIFLTKGSGVDTLRHERGHNWQLMMLGIVTFGYTVGIPSPLNLGKWNKAENYYGAPWETMADILGGVEGRTHSKDEIVNAWVYYAVSTLCFPFTAFYWF